MYNQNKYNKKYYLKHKERLKRYKKEYYKSNKEKINKHNKKYRLKHKEQYLKYRKEYDKRPEVIFKKKLYYSKNNQKFINYRKQYYKENKRKLDLYSKLYGKKYRKRLNLYQKLRFHKDINFRLSIVLRNRINRALKRNTKKGHSIELIGCSIQQLKLYIQQKFRKGMSWNNYGKWHIDHIIPCARFDLSKESEQRKCFHYTNLQPLWAKDNYSKRVKDKINT